MVSASCNLQTGSDIPQIASNCSDCNIGGKIAYIPDFNNCIAVTMVHFFKSCSHVCIECFDSLLTRLVRPDAVSWSLSCKHSSRSWERVSVQGHVIDCQCCCSPHTTWAQPPIPPKAEPQLHCKAPDSVLCRGSHVLLRYLRCKMWVMVLWTQDKMAAVWHTQIYMLWVQSKCVKWSEKTWIISTVSPCERWDFLIGAILFYCWSLTEQSKLKRMITSAVSNPSELPNVT